MTGETNLEKLLLSMSPVVFPEEYIFYSVPDGKYGDYSEYCPVASFMESEGLTLVLTKTDADKVQLKYDAVFKRITLTVHSSLEAVGLTAAVSGKLAENGISANVIAGFFHDHIFVQAEKIDPVLKSLKEFCGGN
jgi:uncharacterized protein